MLKILNTLSIKGTYVKIIRDNYDKCIANDIRNGQELLAFPLRTGTRHGCPLTPFLFSIVCKSLPQQSGERKKQKLSK